MPVESPAVAAPNQPIVRVFTLGRFRVEVDGLPLRFGRKAQRRPLDLLKLLIAYGGEAVSTDQLAEDLWPDAEGDHALEALRTTVSRLRKLIGARAVLGENGSLTLNPEICWVDALALPQLLGDSKLEDAFALYRGGFCAGDGTLPRVLAARARLHSALLRFALDLARRHERAGEFHRAIDIYRKGLEIDPAAEEIARSLIQCCARAGRAAEGIAIYRGFHAAFKSRVGAEPSAATRAVYQELLFACEREIEAGARTPTAPVAPVFGAGRGELTLAVLPFEDLSLRGDHRRLAAAIREGIVSALGVLPEISIVASPDLLPGPNRIFDGRVLLPPGAARYFLRGTVMVAENRLRASVQLLDGRTGHHAWSEQLDHVLGDVIEAQDQVAVKFADGLVAKLVFGDYVPPLLKPQIHTWKGIVLVRSLLMKQRRQDYALARALVSRMLEDKKQEPAVQAISAALALAEGWRCLAREPVKSLRAVERIGRELRARSAENVASIHCWGWACGLRGDFGEALLHGRRAVETHPNNFVSHAFLGLSLIYQDRRAEALARFDDALHVCPQRAHWLYKDRAVAQFCAGMHAEAANDLASTLSDPSQRDCNLLDARMMHVANLAAGGRLEEARHEARETLAAHPAVSASRWCEWQFKPYRVNSPANRIERLLVASGLPL